ncbi:hypothetical protein [Halorarum salinum]|uniref:Uncharacterized protein n=1 Tax=Halorarum salinum TaxID=2743089 RepID=A0A7D5LAR3_9EURY|nr:hypothetical protein [Halobaculum salinum]QLG62027.1 hypothetical protein HUG12_09940 [Halobaculum salinum]
MTECDYLHEECHQDATVLMKYLVHGRIQDKPLCLDHVADFYRKLEKANEELTYVVDLHLLKEGRIWKNGYEPVSAEKEGENAGR